MQTVLTVRTEDITPSPWRNGGGTTRELLARPPGREGWKVRVSVADVAADGPFSTFANVTRWFAVIDGAGVVLDVDGVEHRCAEGDPFTFSGEAATTARLVAGTSRDLNLMLRGVRGAMRRVVAGDAFRPGTRECGLYARSAGRVRIGDDEGEPMPPHALRWWPAAPDSLAFDGAGWWLSADTAPAA